MANSTNFSYADDSTFVVSDTSPINLKFKIKKAIETAQSWFTKNEMRINTDKTEILVFNQTKIEINVTIPILYNKKKIKLLPKPYVEILGVLIDADLSWNNQINRVKKISMDTKQETFTELISSSPNNQESTCIIPS